MLEFLSSDIVKILLFPHDDVLSEKINCTTGFIEFFLQVPLACPGSMAEGSMAGNDGETLRKHCTDHFVSQ